MHSVPYTIGIQYYKANPWKGSRNTLSGFGDGYQCCRVYSAQITFSASLGSMQNISNPFSVSPKLEYGLK